jgi:hypothetical protein
LGALVGFDGFSAIGELASDLDDDSSSSESPCTVFDDDDGFGEFCASISVGGDVLAGVGAAGGRCGVFDDEGEDGLDVLLDGYFVGDFFLSLSVVGSIGDGDGFGCLAGEFVGLFVCFRIVAVSLSGLVLMLVLTCVSSGGEIIDGLLIRCINANANIIHMHIFNRFIREDEELPPHHDEDVEDDRWCPDDDDKLKDDRGVDGPDEIDMGDSDSFLVLLIGDVGINIDFDREGLGDGGGIVVTAQSIDV